MSKRVLAGTLGFFLVLLTTVAAVPASAATVTYVDKDEVWLSSLDGTKKKQISSGEGDWRQVTAADNGRMLGVRLEAGKIAQISKIHLWDKFGATLSQGPLPYDNRGWSSYGAPAGLDLSSDGVFLTYGYFGYTGIIPSANFYRPLRDQRGYKNPDRSDRTGQPRVAEHVRPASRELGWW